MAFVEMDVPEFVASHDGLEIERLEVAASGAEDAMVEHLRALGYLEGDGVDEAPGAEKTAGSDEEAGEEAAAGGDAANGGTDAGHATPSP